MKTIRPIRCPKCKSLEVSLFEYITCAGHWVMGESEGYNIEGDYFKVTGACSDCCYEWTVRGKIQMDDELKSRLAKNKELINRKATNENDN